MLQPVVDLRGNSLAEDLWSFLRALSLPLPDGLLPTPTASVSYSAQYWSGCQTDFGSSVSRSYGGVKNYGGNCNEFSDASATDYGTAGTLSSGLFTTSIPCDTQRPFLCARVPINATVELHQEDDVRANSRFVFLSTRLLNGREVGEIADEVCREEVDMSPLEITAGQAPHASAMVAFLDSNLHPSNRSNITASLQPDSLLIRNLNGRLLARSLDDFMDGTFVTKVETGVDSSFFVTARGLESRYDTGVKCLFNCVSLFCYCVSFFLKSFACYMHEPL